MKNIFAKLGLLLEMIKFEHSIFALPFAYLGLFFAEKSFPSAFLVLWITIAMVSFRTMAMALNRLLDRTIDAQNPRTKGRALPQKKIRPGFVWFSAAVSLLVFEGSAFALGPLCFWLSPVPVALAWIYPLTKRFTWCSHFVLGLILGIAPYGAWLAVTSQFAWAPAFLTAGVLCWVAGFDMIYAFQDIDFDIRHGLFSFPAKFGIAKTLYLTRALHILAVLCWAVAGFLDGAGIIYGLGLVLASCFLVREHSLIRSSGIAKINEIFFVMNAVVSIVLFLAVVLDVIL
ncbi:MAG: putative 4-hydroxybenzoate polyprenyltransferase [Candidatus Omnitrophica bacterium]|nr:putative 4-hydroxybenzoate polyprenyltransferase [Candidatus Omnitrophota bacterium]